MTETGTLGDEDFQRFLALIYRVSGISIPTTKRVLVSNRVRRRLKATGIADFPAYYSYLTSRAGAAEMPRFLDEITTNETYFFRDAHQYAWLGQKFVPEMAELGRKNARPKRLRIWSAAASSGAELYSIALTLAEQRGQIPRWPISLLGTDLSEAVLEEARIGSYDERVLRHVSPEMRGRYFSHDATARRWTIKPEIRAMATWKTHNLLMPLESGGRSTAFS